MRRMPTGRASLTAVPRTLNRADMFGVPVHSFHLGGEPRITTCTGACATLVILALILSIAVLRLQSLLEQDEIRTRSYVLNNALGSTDADSNDYEPFDTNADDFFFAVALIDREGELPLEDPRFVKWMARAVEANKGKVTKQKLVPLHRCKDEDLQRMAVP